MNSKESGFFAKHMEKGILAVAVLVLAFVIFNYFIRSPYTVERQGQTLGPAEVEAEIKDAARKLRQKLDGPSPIKKELQIAEFADAYSQQLGQPVVTRLAFSVPFEEVRSTAAKREDGPGDGKEFLVPSPPMPTELAAVSGNAVLDLTEARGDALDEAYAKLIGQSNPPDFRYVSVSGVLDLDDWVRRLRSGDPSLRIPDYYWQGMIGLTGVYLIRETQDPITGKWGERTRVEPMPGQVSYAFTERQWSDADAIGAVTYAKESQDIIARPPFPSTASGTSWVSPEEAAKQLTTEEQQRVRSLRNQINKLQKWIAGAEERMLQQGQTIRREPRFRQPEPEPGDFRDGPDARQPRARPRPRQQAGSDQERQLDRWRQQLADAQRELVSITGIEETSPQTGPDGEPLMPGEMMFDPATGEPMGPMQPGGPGMLPHQMPQGRQQQPVVRQGNKVKVWAHDLTVEPGKTYRYKIVASMLNPLFRRTQLSKAQHAEMFNKLSLHPSDVEISSADWTEPVRLDRDRYLFLVGGNPQNNRAQIEIWQVFDGRWRRERMDVFPGDPIGSNKLVDTDDYGQQWLDMRTNLLMLDLDSVTLSSGPSGRGTKMLMVDLDTGDILARIREQDERSPNRTRLENALEIQDDLAVSSAMPTDN